MLAAVLGEVIPQQRKSHGSHQNDNTPVHLGDVGVRAIWEGEDNEHDDHERDGDEGARSALQQGKSKQEKEAMRDLDAQRPRD